MARMPNPFGPSRPYEMQYESRADAGTIARFFNAVYAWMAAGLALTAVVAWWVSTRPDLMAQIFKGPILIGLVIAQLVLVFTISAATQKLNAMAATALFLLYSALNGLTLSVLFLVYTQATLGSAFLITAGMFGGMSLFGFVTKPNTLIAPNMPAVMTNALARVAWAYARNRTDSVSPLRAE